MSLGFDKEEKRALRCIKKGKALRYDGGIISSLLRRGMIRTIPGGFALTECGEEVMEKKISGKEILTISGSNDKDFVIDKRVIGDIIDKLWDKLGTTVHPRDIEAIIIAMSMCNYASINSFEDEAVKEWRMLRKDSIYKIVVK